MGRGRRRLATLVFLSGCLLDIARAQDQTAQTKQTFNLDEADRKVIAPFVRWFPLLDASRPFTIDIDLNDSQPALDRLQISANELRYHDTKTPVPSVRPSVKPGTAAAGKLPLEIDVSGLTESGIFDLPIQLLVPGLPVQRFTLVLSARDSWILPFFAIFAGVVASFGLRYVARRQEPQQRLLERLFLLRGEVAKLREKTNDPAAVAVLEDHVDRLNTIERESETGNIDDLSKSLADTEVGVSAIKKQRAARAGDLVANMTKGDDLLRSEMLKQPPPDDAERARFTALRTEFAKLRDPLQDGRIDEAEARFHDWTIGCDSFRHERLERFFRILKDVRLPDESADEIKDIELRKGQISRLLNEANRDEAREKLIELSNIVTRKTEVAPLGLDEPAGKHVAGQEPMTVSPQAPGADFLAMADLAREKARTARKITDFASVIVTALSGLTALYFGKPFGTGWDYLVAALWGLGMDNAIHGAGDVLTRLMGGKPN